MRGRERASEGGREGGRDGEGERKRESVRGGGTAESQPEARSSVLPPRCVATGFESLNVLVISAFACKVSDFGLSTEMERKDVFAAAAAKAAEEEKMAAVAHTLHGKHHTALLGSPLWMAPEVLRGEDHSKATDVFSFGVVLREMANRAPPSAAGLALLGQQHKPVSVLMARVEAGLRPTWPADEPAMPVGAAPGASLPITLSTSPPGGAPPPPPPPPLVRELAEAAMGGVAEARPSFEAAVGLLNSPTALAWTGAATSAWPASALVRLRASLSAGRSFRAAGGLGGGPPTLAPSSVLAVATAVGDVPSSVRAVDGVGGVPASVSFAPEVSFAPSPSLDSLPGGASLQSLDCAELEEW